MSGADAETVAFRMQKAMSSMPFRESHPYGPSVGRLIEQFARLPGIGRKTAERLTYHILSVSPAEAEELADALLAVKKAIHPCRECFNLTEDDLCSICADPRRQQDVICVVEQPRDVAALEASGVYRGLYHVLQGRLSPLDGIGPEQLTIGALLKRIRRNNVQEIVMATNPTLEGDGTALYISSLLENEPVRITKLARGIASGSVLEFANKDMLADALRGRQNF